MHALSQSRPRPRSLRSGAFFVVILAGALLAGAPVTGTEPLHAQDPDTVPPRQLPPQLPDTLAPDPAAGIPDQVADPEQDTVAPPEAPPETLPAMDPLGPAGFERGVWEWDRAALSRLPARSLLDLLERLPGVVPIRSDIVNQPESGVVFGATAGAIRYVMDGFELDPLVAPTFDPSRIPLLSLSRVRIERRVTGAIVHLESLTAQEPESRSIIEAGTGDFNVQLFRGMFVAPDVLGGPVGMGFERLASNGAAAGATNHTAGWLKWSWVRDATGVQVEYRQSDMDREEPADAVTGLRRDWVVRARGARGPLTGEVYAGASSVEEERETGVVREGSPHGGARLRVGGSASFPVEALATVRLRDHPRLPGAEVEVGIRATPVPFLGLEAETARGWWDAGGATGSWAARAQAGPLLGITAFSEVFGGEALPGGGSTLRFPSPDATELRVTRSGLRAGGTLRLGGVYLAGAALRTRADTVPPLGLPNEGTGPRMLGGEATGFEVMARIPTPWDPFSVQGWYVGMDPPGGWLYLPRRNWRAGLVYHHFPLPSGNLEIFGRLEHVYRGPLTVPGPVPDDEGPGGPQPAVAYVSHYRATNFELSIRIITVRAFLRWENILNRPGQRDLVGFTRPGQHVLYGVKWEFGN